MRQEIELLVFSGQLDATSVMRRSSRYFFATTLGISARQLEQTWRPTFHKCCGSTFSLNTRIHSSRGSEVGWTLGSVSTTSAGPFCFGRIGVVIAGWSTGDYTWGEVDEMPLSKLPISQMRMEVSGVRLMCRCRSWCRRYM
jgi:hypothetical protein